MWNYLNRRTHVSLLLKLARRKAKLHIYVKQQSSVSLPRGIDHMLFMFSSLLEDSQLLFQQVPYLYSFCVSHECVSVCV